LIAGVALGLVTSLSWAAGNVFVQRSSRGLGAARALFWALLFGAVAAGLGSLAFDQRSAPLTPAVLVWTVAAALAGLLAYVCLFSSFERAPLSLATPLIASWSLVAGALSLTVFGERLGPFALAGAGVVLAGVLLVAIGGAAPGPAAAGGRPGSALLIALGAAVGFGIMVPSLTHVAPAWGPLGATAAVYGIGVLIVAPLGVFGIRGLSLRPPPRALWGLVLGTGTFETAGFVSLSFARRYAPMTVVTPVSSLAVAFTVLYAWVVLRERPPRLAAVGAVLAASGVVMLALGP